MNVNFQEFNTIKLNKRLNSALLDSGFYSKTASGISEKEYGEAIAKQAQSDAAAGCFQSSLGYKKLNMSYISEISPDRKNIISEYFRMLLSSGKKNVRFAIIYDENGEEIATYDSVYGLRPTMTSKEATRMEQFNKIYNDAYFKALRKSKIDIKDLAAQVDVRA